MHEVLVNRLGGLSLPRKSVVRLTDRPDMTLDVYRGRKTTMQCNGFKNIFTINKLTRSSLNVKIWSKTPAGLRREIGFREGLGTGCVCVEGEGC